MLLGLGGPVVTSPLKGATSASDPSVNSGGRLTSVAGERGKRRTDDVLKRHVGEGGYLPLCWMAWRFGHKQSDPRMTMGDGAPPLKS
jgi:hypothetical protein